MVRLRNRNLGGKVDRPFQSHDPEEQQRQAKSGKVLNEVEIQIAVGLTRFEQFPHDDLSLELCSSLFVRPGSGLAPAAPDLQLNAMELVYRGFRTRAGLSGGSPMPQAGGSRSFQADRDHIPRPENGNRSSQCIRAQHRSGLVARRLPSPWST